MTILAFPLPGQLSGLSCSQCHESSMSNRGYLKPPFGALPFLCCHQFTCTFRVGVSRWLEHTSFNIQTLNFWTNSQWHTQWPLGRWARWYHVGQRCIYMKPVAGHWHPFVEYSTVMCIPCPPEMPVKQVWNKEGSSTLKSYISHQLCHSGKTMTLWQ